MAKTVVSSTKAPQAIGPYSQAIAVDGWIFCSGQVPIDSETGELIEGDISSQTRRCLENLKAVLDEAGATMDSVVKVSAFLTDLGDFGEFNDAYAEFFVNDPPARATVGVAALPKGARVEVECIARLAG